VNGIYDALINLLESKVKDYEVWNNTVGSNESGSESGTMGLNIQRHKMQETIGDIFNELSYKFKQKHPEVFVEFFPDGKDAFNHLTVDNTEPLVSSLLTVCGKHNGEIDGTNVQTLQDELNDYQKIEKDKNDSKVTVKTGSHDGNVLHDAAANAMFRVLLKLADIHFDDLEKIPALYDAEYLNVYVNAKKRTERNKAKKNKPS
jgi:hypothetical protein